MISYDIIGFGNWETEQEISKCILEESLSDFVKLHGRIPNENLDQYFKKCNIGIAFVPLVPEYDCQPTTKLFEYLLAGMPVLATATLENSLIIDNQNGILTDDSPEGFSNGLHAIIDKLQVFDSNSIKESVKGYTWKGITEKILTTLLN